MIEYLQNNDNTLIILLLEMLKQYRDTYPEPSSEIFNQQTWGYLLNIVVLTNNPLSLYVCFGMKAVCVNSKC